MNVQLLLGINSLAGKNVFIDSFMIFCAEYLVYFVFIITIVWIGYTFYKRQWKSAAYFLGSLFVSFIVLQIMGQLYIDHRPFVDHHLTQLVAHAAGRSFPSDHTTVTTAIALSFIYLTKLKKLGWILLGFAILIGFARIFVGVHYPVDILGGLATGFIGTTLAFGIYKLIEAKRQNKMIAPSVL